NCSLLGIGERTGNIPLEAMVIEYASMRGTFDGMDPTVITEIARYFEKELGYDIPPMTPFVGNNFNVTRAGIHADGLMKDAEIYNIFDTEKVLNRPAEVSISNTSGLAGIAYWVNNHFGLKGSDAVTKQDQFVIDMKAKIDAQYVDGRTTIMGDEELEAIIHELAPHLFDK
ncbi:MAG: 2-isopropylmalate synthase, partial [Clostridia bacterium]|nr:2-isopropylmalate synthase [Clostridia bacterium]